MTACISSVYQTQVSLPVVKELSNKIIQEKIHYCWQRWWVLKLVRVFLKHLCCWFDVEERVTNGGEPEQAPLLDYNHTHTYITRGFWYQDYYRIWPTARGSYTKKKKTTTPCFFVSIGQANSRLVKYFSKLLPLSLLDPRVFGQGTDSRGTESRGIDSKNFWSRVWFTFTWDWFEEFLVAQPTYYLLRSYLLLVGSSF